MARKKDQDITTLPAPALRSPCKEEIVDGRVVTFIWDAVEGATLYRLEVATDPEFDKIVFEQEFSDRTSLTVANVFTAEGESYFWRVLAENEAGWSNGDHVEGFVCSHDLSQQHLSAPDEKFGVITELMKGSAASAGVELTGATRFREKEAEMGVQQDRVEAGQIAGIAIGILFALITAIIILFQWLGVREQSTFSSTVKNANYPELEEIQSSGAAVLSRYGILDSTQGAYSIPIDRAMELIVNERSSSRGREDSMELP